jgi:hypothetical protein
MKPAQSRNVFFPILAASVAAALLPGCATAPHGDTRTGPGSPAVTGVQYATSTEDAGCETVEVFIFNPGTLPVIFKGAYLDGTAIAGSSRRAAEMARKFSFGTGGTGFNLRRPPPAADPRVIWSQFQPSHEITPGGFGVFQIGFRGMTCHAGSFNLSLETVDGTCVDTVIPRLFPAGRRITAVTWSPDGSVVNVQYSGGTAPQALLVDEVPLPSMRILEHPVKGRPGVVCGAMPCPAEPGAPVLITLDFGGGKQHRFLARALLDIVVDAPNGWRDSETLREELRLEHGFDANPAVKRIDVDVACGDTRAHRHGHRAPDVIDARVKAYTANPARLYGVEFCTAQYPEIWNIYTPIADAVFAKPYQLSLSRDPAAFIENELDTLSFIVGASAPRPVVWIPERYKKERRVEGRELEVLAWAAFLSGARGVCYHYWKNDPENPFGESVDVPGAMSRLNRELNSIRPILSMLIHQQSSGDRSGMTHVHEGWSGDAGVLLLVRNMRYSTDGRPNGGGRNPRFNVTAAEKVKINYLPPPWLMAGQAVDPLLGEPLETTAGRDGELSIRIPRLDSHQLVWIPNTDPSALSRPPPVPLKTP